MKTIARVLIIALFVAGLATTSLVSANASTPSASGIYRFVMEDGLTKQIEFNATRDEKGVTTGEFTFTDESGIAEYDPDGEPGEPQTPTPLSVTARLDSLTIENNRAVMGGTVTDSSHRSFIGQYVQLVVEDNGAIPEIPDKLSWCFCQPQPGGWVPSDAEDPHDQGVYLTWWATDAELRDDYGMPSPNLMPGILTSCETFPIDSYEFPEVRGEGQIEVHQ